MLGLIVALMITTIGFYLWQRNRRAVPDPVELRLRQVSQSVSDRLVFRLPELDDEQFFLEMAVDPTAAEANGWDGTEAAVVRARFGNQKNFIRLRQNELVAIDRATGERVGTATFSHSATHHAGGGSTAARSTGIHVHPDHRNQGYGREIMSAALLWLQSTPGPIIVGTRVTNVGLQRIMKQLGYQAEAETPAFIAPDGHSYPAYWYWCSTRPDLTYPQTS